WANPVAPAGEKPLGIAAGNFHVTRIHSAHQGRHEELLYPDFSLRFLHESLSEWHLAHAIRAFDPVSFANERIAGELSPDVEWYGFQLPCPINADEISSGVSTHLALVRAPDFKTCAGEEQANAAPSGAI